jgi:hypothetical protein
MTTDIRPVYSTMLQERMGFENGKAILKGAYLILGAFG